MIDLHPDKRPSPFYVSIVKLMIARQNIPPILNEHIRPYTWKRWINLRGEIARIH